MLASDLLEVLCCPLTRQPLALAEPTILAKVNARHGLNPPFQAAMIRADRTVLYPIEDGIPVLLPDRAIPI